MKNFIRKLFNKKINPYLFDKNGNYLIKWVNFEFNSSCNLRCKWCSLDHSKKRQIMRKNTLIKCLDELTSNKRFILERIDLHNAGETLLHPALEEMLSLIQERKNGLKNKPLISLLTNAVLLNEEKAKIIIKSGAIDEIRFSLDGGTKKSYEDIRRGSNWEKVKKNILNFLAMNQGKVRTGLICLIPDDKPLTSDWMDKDFQELFSKIGNNELRKPHNWDGSEQLELKNPYTETSNGRVCKFLLKNIVILPNGDLTVCCADLNSRGVLGNVNKSSIESLILSKERKLMLKLFANGQKNKIDLCKSCCGYYE